MHNKIDLFNQTINEIEKIWSINKKLSDFVNFPKNLVLKEKSINKINVTNKLLDWKLENDHKYEKVHNLISNLSLFNVLLSIKRKIPAIANTKNNNISNKFFSIEIDAPKKAKGIDPIRYGISNLKFILPDLK